MHIWDPFTLVEEVVRAQDGVVRSGRALYVSICDTPAWIASRAVTLADEGGLERFAALQVPYGLVERTVERDLLPTARALDLAVSSSPSSGRAPRPKWATTCALEADLTEEQPGRLDEASRIEPGFPHDFGGARLAYGETLGLIDDHRALVDPLV